MNDAKKKFFLHPTASSLVIHVMMMCGEGGSEVFIWQLDEDSFADYDFSFFFFCFLIFQIGFFKKGIELVSKKMDNCISSVSKNTQK